MHYEVEISKQERENGVLNAVTAEKIIATFDEFGHVVVADMVPRSVTSALREKINADLKVLQSKYSENLGAEFRGQILMNCPPTAPHLHRDILLNPLLEQICHEMLGKLKGFRMEFYKCNMNLPNSEPQRVHADLGHLWPGMFPVHPPYAAVVNFALLDTDERNGAIELWPGTHKNPLMWHGGESQYVPDAVLHEVRSSLPPIRCVMSEGAVLIRDPRQWHRGVTNPSSLPRPMLTLLYMSGFMHFGYPPMLFPETERAFFSGHKAKLNAEFVTAMPDYLVPQRN